MKYYFMNKKTNLKHLFLIIICALALLPACRKPRAPQLPSNRPIEQPEEIDLLRINQGMVAQEDSLLNLYVLESASDFERTETGFWYKKEHITQNRLLKRDDVVVIHYRLYSLDGTLLEEEKNFSITVGRKEFIQGIDEALELMRTGETAVFIFPSNLAFRLRGYGNLVPPYTPVIFRITIPEL
jgi:hypothetical protein